MVLEIKPTAEDIEPEVSRPGLFASFLDEEMRTFKNFPMTCQSLQSVAAFLKFD